MMLVSQRIRSFGRTATLAAVDAAVLWFARSQPARVSRLIRHPDASLARLGADELIALLARTALWLAAAWVAFALLTVCGTQLPGLAGRACRGIATIAVPAAARRALLGAVGLGVGVGLFAGPAAPGALASPAAATAPRSVFCVTLVARDAVAVDATLPAPPWPGSPRQGDHGSAHHSHDHRPDHHRPHAHRPKSAGNEPAGHVRVRRGDSLWLIAARRLGPDATPARTATYWPQIYAANRASIGADPDVISPDQVLHLPAPDPTHEGVQR